MSELTEAEREVFEALASGDYDNFCLVRAELDGKEVAVICSASVSHKEYLLHLDNKEVVNTNEVELVPLYISVQEDMDLQLHLTPQTDGEEECQTIQ